MVRSIRRSGCRIQFAASAVSNSDSQHRAAGDAGEPLNIRQESFPQQHAGGDYLDGEDRVVGGGVCVVFRVDSSRRDLPQRHLHLIVRTANEQIEHALPKRPITPRAEHRKFWKRAGNAGRIRRRQNFAGLSGNVDLENRRRWRHDFQQASGKLCVAGDEVVPQGDQTLAIGGRFVLRGILVDEIVDERFHLLAREIGAVERIFRERIRQRVQMHDRKRDGGEHHHGGDRKNQTDAERHRPPRLTACLRACLETA